MRSKYINEYETKLENNEIENDCRKTFTDYISQRQKDLSAMIDTICDYMEKKQH